MESRSHRRIGRNNIGSHKARCSKGFAQCRFRVTQLVYGTGSCRALSESQRRCSTILPGGQRAGFAPGRKRRQMPVRKSAALTPSKKPLTLLPQPSGSRAAAGLEKISSLQCNSCLAVGGFMVVDCLHQVPRVHDSSLRCPL